MPFVSHVTSSVLAFLPQDFDHGLPSDNHMQSTCGHQKMDMVCSFFSVHTVDENLSGLTYDGVLES